MRRARLLPALVLIALVALSLSAGAAALFSLTLAELVGGSDLVAEGKVVSTKCVRPRAAGLIYTDVELEVTAVHKGAAAGRAVVRVPGGFLGGVGCHVAGAGRFVPGEQVLCFLANRGGALRVVGMAQGKFSIHRDAEGALVAERDFEGATLIARPAARAREGGSASAKATGAGRGAKPADELPGGSISLQRLRAEIVRLVAEERARTDSGAGTGGPSAAAFEALPGPGGPGLSHHEGAASEIPPAAPLADTWRNAPALAGVWLLAGSILAAAALVIALAWRRGRLTARGVALLALIGAGALGAVAGSAHAYTRSEAIPFGSGVYLKWNDSDIPVEWRLDSDAGSRTRLSQSDIRNTLLGSFDQWQDVEESYLAFTNLSDGASPKDFVEDFNNYIFWANGTEVPDFTPGVLGFCAAYYDGVTGRITDADIGFNFQHFEWQLSGAPWYHGATSKWVYPIDSVGLHEMGHLFGLDHSGCPAATMFYLWQSGSETLDQDDKDGVAAIYPDVAPPSAPVITSPADDPHSQAGDPAVAISGTCAADTKVIRVNGSTSGVTYTAGNTTWSYSGTLTAPGDYDHSVRAYDAAGNESAADTVQIQYTTTDPYVSSLVLSDATSGLTAITNAFSVNVALAAADDGTITKYLLKEDSTPPDVAEMNSDGADSAPATFDLASTSNGRKQGARTLHAWVMDDGDNISQTVSATIAVDTLRPMVAPAAEALSVSKVLVRFSEQVAGGDLAGSYSISGGRSVTGATDLGDGDAFVLTVSPALTGGSGYTVTVSSAVTDLTTENCVAAPYNTASLTAAAGSAPTVLDPAIDVNHEVTDVQFSEPVDPATACAVDNWRVLRASFSGTSAYRPYWAEVIGGNVVRLHHFNTHDVCSREYRSPAGGPWTEKLTVRNVQNLAGNAIAETDITLYVENDPDYFYSAVDSAAPTISAFAVRDPVNGDTTDTWFPTVLVDLTASDGGTWHGEVVRWHLSESAVTPTTEEMYAFGLPYSPRAFTLSEGSGARTVYAWVMDNFGKVSSPASAGITLLAAGTPNSAPEASYTTVVPGYTVLFSSDGSTAGSADGIIVAWHWDFDDGGATSDEASPSHVFSAPGVYDVELTVTDDRGGTDTDTVTITVLVDTGDPVLEIPTVTVAGRVDSAAVTQVKLTVDETAAESAVLDSSSGGFSGDVAVQVGANTVRIRNAADNSIIGTVTITRSEP